MTRNLCPLMNFHVHDIPSGTTGEKGSIRMATSYLQSSLKHSAVRPATGLMVVLALWVLPATAQQADALYQQHCAQCHGANLQGGNARSMVDGVWQFGDSAGYISRNIKNGITHLGMPAFGKTLTDRETKELSRYLLEAQNRAGAVKPPPPRQLQTLDYEIKVEVWVDGLEIPWSVAPISADSALITERPGRLRIVRDGQLLPEPVRGLPPILAEGQGGLLDVALDPDYAAQPWVYLAYSHGLPVRSGESRAPAMTRIVRGRIRDHSWVDQAVLFEAHPDTYGTARVHFGSRIVFDPGGHLYFSIGDRGQGEQAQNPARPNGKIHRIHRDGSIPTDNPFADQPDALPSLYSIGHRNPQGVSVHPVTGAVWASEHGPMGGDELNCIRARANYGWPEITYGLNYNGSPVSDVVRRDGMEQPIWYWKPSTAVCGMEFYQGDLFPRWNNKLLVGSLKYEDVRVLDVEEDRVMHEEVILKNAGRVRDVTCGPDGAVYIVLNGPDVILRLTPGE